MKEYKSVINKFTHKVFGIVAQNADVKKRKHLLGLLDKLLDTTKPATEAAKEFANALIYNNPYMQFAKVPDDIDFFADDDELFNFAAIYHQQSNKLSANEDFISNFEFGYSRQDDIISLMCILGHEMQHCTQRVKSGIVRRDQKQFGNFSYLDKHVIQNVEEAYVNQSVTKWIVDILYTNNLLAQKITPGSFKYEQFVESIADDWHNMSYQEVDANNSGVDFVNNMLCYWLNDPLASEDVKDFCQDILQNNNIVSFECFVDENYYCSSLYKKFEKAVAKLNYKMLVDYSENIESNSKYVKEDYNTMLSALFYCISMVSKGKPINELFDLYGFAEKSGNILLGTATIYAITCYPKADALTYQQICEFTMHKALASPTFAYKTDICDLVDILSDEQLFYLIPEFINNQNWNHAYDTLNVIVERTILDRRYKLQTQESLQTKVQAHQDLISQSVTSCYTQLEKLAASAKNENQKEQVRKLLPSASNFVQIASKLYPNEANIAYHNARMQNLTDYAIKHLNMPQETEPEA